MAVHFAPQYRDPDEEFKRTLLQIAMMYGGKKRETGDIRDIAQYGQYQQQLGGAEELQQALMGMTLGARQQYQGPTPQFPAFQQAPQMRTQFGVQELARRTDPLYQAQTKDYRARAKEKLQPKIEKLRYKDAKGKMKIWRGSAEDLPEIVDLINETGGTIDTTKSTLSDERLRLYQEAKARGDDKAAELALYGKPLVEVQFGKPAAAAERTKIAETRASIDALDNLKILFDSAQTKTGPIVGRTSPIAGLIGMTTDEQEAFMAATSAFKNKIIKEITGAQMSEVEAKRIMKQIPDITDPPTRWKAKWEQSKKNLEFLQKRRLEILEQSGLRVPGTESQIEIPEDIQDMSDEELKELAGIE